MEYVLETNSITKKYKDFTALNSLSMHIPKGSIYGFVGKNGAGKTTLIRIITGLQTPTDGDYSIYGVSSKSSKINGVRNRIGAVVETPSIYQDMTAYDNLKYQYKLIGNPDYSTINDLLKLVGLENTGKKKARNFSLGMRQRLGIAVALAGNPDFIILDEPINGLDPQGIIDIRELILKLNKEMGITVLISSHILDELSRLATHYGFVDNGSIIAEVSAQELEEKCRKSIKLKVDSINALISYLDKNKIEYSIISNDEALVYANPEITGFVTELLNNQCRVLTLSESEESLESYFINLIGGAK